MYVPSDDSMFYPEPISINHEPVILNSSSVPVNELIFSVADFNELC